MIKNTTLKTLSIFLLLNILLACSSTQTSQKTSYSDSKNLDEVITEILNQVANSTSDKAIRLAVIEFIPTQEKYKEKNEFGKFFTERLTTALKSQSQKIKLFEREQLETITKEHQLNLSGLIDESMAVEIGKLAPIDKIVTGSYTKLKTYIDINGRMLDVATGEIIQTFHWKVKLSENLQSLLEVEKIHTPNNLISESQEECKEEKEKINTMLGNLSSKERIDALVKYAVTIPFHSKCGEYHSKILYAFIRNKIFNNTYKQFLIKSLYSTPNTPHNSYKIQLTLKYFAKDGWIDEEEWKAGLAVLKSVYKHWINVYANYMFIAENISSEQIENQKNRIDEFFHSVHQNKISLPTPVDGSTAFLEIINIFIVEGEHELFYYCYDNYSNEVEDAKKEKLFGILKKLHDRHSNDEQKLVALKKICDYFNRMSPSEKLASQMYDFYRTFSDRYQKDANVDLNEKELGIFVKTCKNKIKQTFPLIKYNNQRKELQLFCYKYQIVIPNFTYSVSELEEMLSDKNRTTQENAAEFLVEMGEQAKSSEKTVLKMLRRARYLKLSTRMQKSLIDILGNIKSVNPEVHRTLIKNLSNRGSYVPDRAKLALAKIGKPVIGLLKKELSKQETYVQIYMVEIFGMMGKQASAVKTYLKTLKANTKSDHLKFAIEDALEKI